MDKGEQNHEVRFENNDAFMTILSACEEVGTQISKVVNPSLDERREVGKHIVTLSSSLLVLSMTITSVAWTKAKSIPCPFALKIIWTGFALSILLSLWSLSLQIGSRSYLQNVWNQSGALNEKLNEDPNALQHKEAIAMSRKALNPTLAANNRSLRFLTFALFVFGGSMIALALYGWLLFN